MIVGVTHWERLFVLRRLRSRLPASHIPRILIDKESSIKCPLLSLWLGFSASNTKIGADQGHVQFRRDPVVVQARQNARQVLSLIARNERNLFKTRNFWNASLKCSRLLTRYLCTLCGPRLLKFLQWHASSFGSQW